MTNTETAPLRTLTAKYPGRCPCCTGAISVGAPVLWAPGQPARHATCGTAARPSSPARKRNVSTGRRTGCSCGSREDAWGDLIPSDRNCESCEHDA